MRILKPSVRLVSITADTAESHARIRSDLLKAGTPVPANGMWIAAQALEHGATLVTFDSHFGEVPGLMLWHGWQR